MHARRSKTTLPLVILALGAAPPAFAQTLSPLTFREMAREAGVDGVNDPGPWFDFAGIAPMSGGGVVADFDRDGDQDLFVLTGGGGPDKLFLNDGDGTFTESAAQAGLAQSHMGMGAAAGDYDGDGWIDIFITSVGDSTFDPQSGQHRLMRNLGDGTFVDVAPAAGVTTSSPYLPEGLGAAFGDYDLDGDLDLYVAGWRAAAHGNRLFRNEGDGTFTDVTLAAGVDDTEIRGFSPRFVDMDGDRYPELLVAADFETSRYFKNEGDGTFSDITGVSGTGLDGNGMGHTVGDFNGDLALDWYVTSIHSLNPGSLDIPGTGNMLYLSEGAHSFVEASERMGVNDGGWGWGVVNADFDHDGRLDIAETNGFRYLNGDGIFEWWTDPSYLWLQTENGTFVESAMICGFHHNLEGRGLASADLDLDGDQDLVLFTRKGAVHLFENELPADAGHSLRIVLDTSAGADAKLAPDGFGTRVIATAQGRSQLRVLDGGCNFLTQSELALHFGLGAAAVVDLRIEWANGRTTWMDGVPANQTLAVAYCPADWNGRDGAGLADLSDFLADHLAGEADFDLDGDTDAADLSAFIAALRAGC